MKQVFHNDKEGSKGKDRGVGCVIPFHVKILAKFTQHLCYSTILTKETRFTRGAKNSNQFRLDVRLLFYKN